MRRIYKVIIIIELILLLIFISGYLLFEKEQLLQENYSQIRQPTIARVNESSYNISVNLSNGTD